MVDFSFHTATLASPNLCVEHKKAIRHRHHRPLRRGEIANRNIESQIPIVWSSNFSTGVNTLFWLTRKAAEILGPAFDLEVVEMHHRLKKDAPSGTATIAARKFWPTCASCSLKKSLRHGREGIVGERTRDGNRHSRHSRRRCRRRSHRHFRRTTGERLELTHKASSRDTFANGALRAAQWVVKQKPGLYDMQDVLGLK